MHSMSPNKKGIIQALEDLITDKDVDISNKKKILMVGAEVAPYAYVGGVAMVLGYLSKAISDLGADVRLFMPKFYNIDEDKYKLEMVYEGLQVPTDDEEHPYLICNVKEATAPHGVKIYF